MNVKVQDGDVSMRGETHTVKSARMAVETLGAVVGETLGAVVGETGALHVDYWGWLGGRACAKGGNGERGVYINGLERLGQAILDPTTS